jgi:hypothetical protein
MKTTILGVALLAAIPAMAQTTQPVVEDFKPSTLNQPGQQYPQVNSQRFARFRVVVWLRELQTGEWSSGMSRRAKVL